MKYKSNCTVLVIIFISFRILIPVVIVTLILGRLQEFEVRNVSDSNEEVRSCSNV